MDNFSDITVIQTDTWKPVHYTNTINLVLNRYESAEVFRKQDDPLVTIFFQAYNGLEENTKYSLPAILKYTEGIDYELVLIDNGSNDGTFEYFKKCPYKKKKIYRITKNIGSLVGRRIAELNTGRFYRGKYILSVPNDVVATKNYLNNMLKCMESDEQIGVVAPMNDNGSNYQQLDLKTKTLEEFQIAAAKFNQSDPRKWEERLRAMPTMSLFRAELWTMLEDDPAFIHYFSDDDYCFQYRRLGYKLMVCGDVIVHHGGTMAPRSEAITKFHEGARIFQKKYYGIDSWKDTLNYEWEMREVALKKVSYQEKNNILGIDVRCGSPILNLKNGLRMMDMPNAILSAFTEDVKYWMDLKSICDGEVFCGDIDRMLNKIGFRLYDYILLGRYLDEYKDGENLLLSMSNMLAVKGRLLLKVHRYPRAQSLSGLLQLLRESDLSKFDVVGYYQQFLYNRRINGKSYEIKIRDLENMGVVQQLKSLKGKMSEQEASDLDEVSSSDRIGLLLSEHIICIENSR